VWRATAHHFALARIDDRWQITTCTSSVFGGNPGAHALPTKGLAGRLAPAPPDAQPKS
jgi:hypothetical protein